MHVEVSLLRETADLVDKYPGLFEICEVQPLRFFLGYPGPKTEDLILFLGTNEIPFQYHVDGTNGVITVAGIEYWADVSRFGDLGTQAQSYLDKVRGLVVMETVEEDQTS